MVARWQKISLGIVAGLVFVGCGNGGAPTASPTTAAATTTSTTSVHLASPSSTKPSTTATIADYSDPSEVIQALGHEGLECKSPSPVQVTESDLTYLQAATMCAIDGEEVVVAVFATADQRATYETIGEQGRGAYPHWVLGTTWAVATFTRVTAEHIAAAIGGAPH